MKFLIKEEKETSYLRKGRSTDGMSRIPAPLPIPPPLLFVNGPSRLSAWRTPAGKPLPQRTPQTLHPPSQSPRMKA